MTEQEKELLLKDLCARLPHKQKVCYKIHNNSKEITETLSGCLLDYFKTGRIAVVRPYLRPMSSMTEEEKKEYQELYDYEERSYNQGCEFYDEWKVEINDEERLFKITDWLNAHHFDYREMIEKGLALEAPEEMYQTKNTNKDEDNQI